MKKYFLILASFMLAACSISEQNLTYSTKPILNITSSLSPLIQIETTQKSAVIKNKSQQLLNISYHLYWYDHLGVTQIWENQQESYSAQFLLKPQEQKSIDLTKPTVESKNYRLYLK
ncbi:hypothetical protein BVZ87_00440 [Haemophilus influenzae]|uniref:YcfL family protein n=1 Tax=Haemophilus influenzae TaxID=727 RepID=UPI000CFECE51|nr:DUF1425 domain-containing protein [Haemophilus influenzae]PRI65512.1 hypothetical protein BVZ87_00440 [Haemophilus influenzae]PRM14592.1 hypothetical protein BV002_01718 [Haemophilus influenzae]